jgi:hypothetical protein
MKSKSKHHQKHAGIIPLIYMFARKSYIGDTLVYITTWLAVLSRRKKYLDFSAEPDAGPPGPSAAPA